MGAICHITPVLNNILDLCRFDLTYLNPPSPAKISQDAFHHITPQPFNQSASSRSRHNKNHVLPKRSTMLKSISCLKIFFYWNETFFGRYFIGMCEWCLIVKEFQLNGLKVLWRAFFAVINMVYCVNVA